jgi:hypothetical protein
VRTRLIVLVALAVLLAGVMVTGALTKDDGGVRVQAGGPSLLTTTTQTPVTTASEAVSTTPITAPIPVATTTTVVTAASASPPTTPEATSQVAAQEVPEAAPVPEEVQPETTQTAVRAETKCLADEATCHPPTTEAEWATPDWARCPQWWPTAKAVGWDLGDMPTLDYIMKRESGCDPTAVSRIPCGRGNHATGLTQLCGWLPYNEAINPTANLAKALELRRSSGWCPWVLRGDRVTGNAC